MDNLYRVVLSFALFSSSGFALAATCDAPASSKEFYLCTLDRHPEKILTEKNKTLGDSFVSQAGQLAYPELGSKVTKGSKDGEGLGSAEVSLVFPISDYLFARSKRVKSAEAERFLLQTAQREKMFEIQKQIIVDLFRYRQIQTELDFYLETVETFRKIEKQYASRNALGPEQEVILTLVSLAQSDYNLKKNHLDLEKQEIDSRFKLIWGDSFTLHEKLLPKLRKDWPEIRSETINLSTHFELNRSLAEKQKADAEYDAAFVESFPSFKLGPTFEGNVEGPTRFFSYGINLTVDLPIFGFNSGGRKRAEAQRASADVGYELAQKKVVLENSALNRRYLTAIQSIRSSESKEVLERKHAKIDSLFRQGLLSGTTIIEAHRQLLEFRTSQHEHEKTALEAFLELNQLKGTEPGEILL